MTPNTSKKYVLDVVYAGYIELKALYITTRCKPLIKINLIIYPYTIIE